MNKEDLFAKFAYLDISGSTIVLPNDFIFLCGGELKRTGKIKSVREYFLRKSENRETIFSRRILLAEAVNVFFPETGFDNLIDFEKFVAGGAAITALFLEGPGAIAELGAFNEIPQIRQKLTIFVDASYTENVRSFINDGPIRSLKQYKIEAVRVLDWLNDKKKFDLDKMDNAWPFVEQYIRKAIDSADKQSQFNKDSDIHKLLVILYICDILGAATSREISEILSVIGIDIGERDVRRIFFASEVMKWSIKKERGSSVYYINNVDKEIVRSKLKNKNFDLIRFRVDFLSLWKELGDERHYVLRDLKASSARV